MNEEALREPTDWPHATDCCRMHGCRFSNPECESVRNNLVSCGVPSKCRWQNPGVMKAATVYEAELMGLACALERYMSDWLNDNGREDYVELSGLPMMRHVAGELKRYGWLK